MLIGVIGKTNTGKSTFFSAATLVDVEISNRPFVTIKPNQGTSFVTTPCVHVEKSQQCQPQNSKCEHGLRMIPVTLLDVAGLVPDAWQGKGLGNMFLSDLMQASALIHVLDASGGTDAEGNPVPIGSHDPADDVRFLEREIDYWVKGILQKNWVKISKQATLEKNPSSALASQLSGLGITEDDVKKVIEKKDFSLQPDSWSEEEILRFAGEIRKKSKPMLIAANKADVKGAKENIERLQKEFLDYLIVPCCAEAELALRKAAKAGLIEYLPGNKEFKLLKELPENQKKALEFIQKNVLDVYGSTGVQEALNQTAFKLLDLIVVYPVEDAHKWTSGKGHYLPDAHLIHRGATPHDLAVKIHSSFGERFVAAIDCRNGQRIGKEETLKDKQIVKIQLSH